MKENKKETCQTPELEQQTTSQDNEQVNQQAQQGTEQSQVNLTAEQVNKMVELVDALTAENKKLAEDIDKLNRTCARLQSSADNSDKFRDQLVALKADFDSYRRRMRADQEQSRKQGISDAVQKVLPTLDDLNRAKSHMQDDALVAIDMIITQFTKILNELGVEEMAVLGEMFDANTMNALSTIDCGEENKGKVVEVFKAGYKLGDKVLRYAEVIVGA